MYSTGHNPPKKSIGKGSQGKKTADDSQETVDVSKESEPEPEPVKRKTASRRVGKKKVTIFADDNIIPDPDVALELECKEVQQETVMVMEASVKELGTIQGYYGGHDLVSLQTSSEGTEDQLDDEEKDDKESDADDEGDDHINEDEEMLNAEVEDSGKGDAEVSDAAKADAEKTKEAKDDSKKAELSPTSSSLSISFGFGDQFLKGSSDTSLVGTVKGYLRCRVN
ncbi:hypothetical protein Tco_0605928 [Tanacetum coccineum]